MKISEIRALIYALRCNRNDLCGLPDAEFERTDVPARLNPFIEACKAVVIAPKFKQDIENRRLAVEKAEALIQLWYKKRTRQGKPDKPLKTD